MRFLPSKSGHGLNRSARMPVASKNGFDVDRSFISRVWFHALKSRAGGGRARKQTYAAAE